MILKTLKGVCIIALSLIKVSYGMGVRSSTTADKPLVSNEKKVNNDSAGNIVFPSVVPLLSPLDNRPSKLFPNGVFSFSPVVKKVAPSVVNIYSERVQIVQNSPPEMDPMMQLFLGKGFNFDSLFAMPREIIQRSLGSGVVIGKEGTVLTNVHVIQDATKIKVILQDGRVFDAKVAVKDEKIDLAVLQIQDPNVVLTPIEMGDPEAMEVGDMVVAIGNPFGVGTTVTTGIVSAVSRFGGFIQTDASINVGNSGGALVNLEGQLIGINNFIISKSGSSAGLGFAIPINMAKPALAQLNNGGGDVQRGWSGLLVQSITPQIAKTFEMDIPNGVVVSAVHPSRPAKDVQVGDLIVEMNGKPLADKETFFYRLAGIPVGESVELLLKRKKASLKTRFALLKPIESPLKQRTTLKGNHVFDGVVVANLSPALEAELNLEGMREGAIILGAVRQSTALRIFQKFDIVHMINNQSILNVNELIKVLSTEKIKSIKLVRNGKTVEIK
jgi:Do/DeqQ family serine protease